MKNVTEEFYATEEPPVKAVDFLAELSPLLGDYFVGNIILSCRGITYCLPNGQTILLTAENLS